MDTGLVDIVSAIFSLLVTVVLLKFWRPSHIESVTQNGALSAAGHAHSTVQVIRGWSPFILSSMFIFLLGLQAVNAHLKFAPLTFPLLGLHNRVLKVPPVAAVPTPESAIIDLNVLALPGTAVFFGAFIAGVLFGLRIRRMFILLGRTLRQLVPSLLAISFMVGLAYITRYSGMDAVMGLSLTRTGWSYPFFGTLLGWLGVALTGTDAGSNALFGNLQTCDRRAAPREPDPDGRRQQRRRRDGQDDRRAVDRRVERRDATGGQRSGHLQGRLPAQYRARLTRRLACAPVRIRVGGRRTGVVIRARLKATSGKRPGS